MGDETTAQNPTNAEASPATLLTAEPSADGKVTEQGKPAETPAAESGKEGEPAKPAEGTENKPPEGAPEKYEFKAADGKDFDPHLVDTFSAAAKEANLTQDAAQKLIEKMAPALAARQQEQIASIQNGWLESTKSDKEFGGEKLQENMGVAAKALDQFDPRPKDPNDPEKSLTTPLRQLLNDTGLGNHPDVIRFFFRAGQALSEDKFVGGGAAKPNTDGAKSLYPNSHMN